MLYSFCQSPGLVVNRSGYPISNRQECMSEKATHYPRRAVRSYVLRAGRLTRAQQLALNERYPIHGISDEDLPIEPDQLFGSKAPLVVEIGFGNGEATWQMAQRQPDHHFIGIEVHPPGVGSLLQRLDEHRLTNVRIFMGDAVPFLRDRIPDRSLAGVRIFFPDPWPKKRHHKRRIVQADFAALLAEKLTPGGVLHLATDWEPYAEHILEVMNADSAFKNLSDQGDYCPQPDWRPDTKYERRGTRLGHKIHDLVFETIS